MPATAHQPVHTLIVVQQDPERLVDAALLDDVGGLDVDVVYNLQTTDRFSIGQTGRTLTVQMLSQTSCLSNAPPFSEGATLFRKLPGFACWSFW
jgi:hypothetical protein